MMKIGKFLELRLEKLSVGTKLDKYRKFSVASNGNTTVGGTLDVTGDTELTGDIAITGSAEVGGNLEVTGTSTHTGNATFSGTVGVTGDATVGGTLTATGAIVANGGLTAVKQTAVSETTGTRVCTSADYGKQIWYSYAGAIAVTLPANGAPAGTFIDMLISTEDAGTVTISAATAGTLRSANKTNGDAVTFATGHRIGAYARFISDGAYWYAINLGNTTMGT